MLIELYIFAFITIAYGAFITFAIIGIGRLTSTQKKSTVSIAQHFISIIISARNEATMIKQCIEQIDLQQFPKENFELIIIDDASEDETFELVSSSLNQTKLTYTIIKQSLHQGKKKNIVQGIEIAKGSIIITTDADVTFRHPNWLSSISDYFNNYQPNLLIMPIDFETQFGFIQRFQIIENIALTGITAGYCGLNKAFMCNGANLAFKKEAYFEVNGYHSHLSISSGEDVFLLEDLKKLNPKLIHYSLNTILIVKTKPVSTLKSLFNQRIRWAYKAKYNTNVLNILLGIIILSANLLIAAWFVAMLKKSVIIPYLSIFVFTKLIFDFLLLFLASNFLGRSKYIWWIIPFQSVYWIYAFIIGISSIFFKPRWKGKKIT